VDLAIDADAIGRCTLGGGVCRERKQHKEGRRSCGARQGRKAGGDGRRARWRRGGEVVREGTIAVEA